MSIRKSRPPIVPPEQPAPSVPVPAGAHGVPTPTPVQETGRAGLLSPEFRRLLQLVRRTAKIRPELVERVLERLRSGHYLTAQAAQQAAEALLQFSP
jgi:hypothetical protein